jgi:ABC-2 type transport system permease protein
MVQRDHHRRLRRYARLFLVQLRTSFALAVQYRFDFFIEGVLALLWLGITLVPLMVVFAQRTTVAGWSYPEALVVVGLFSVLKAVLDGAITPSLNHVVDGIRKGTLDFILLKPADAQFLVSTARFDPWRILDLFGSIAIVLYALRRLHHVPSAWEALSGCALFSVAILLIYSLWILVVSLSFRVVKVDNLSYLFMSIFDAGRWPIHVFKGALRVLFTVVFPLALMTTYPAQALLGHLSLAHALLAGAGGLLFAGCARWIWQRSLHAYTSASS